MPLKYKLPWTPFKKESAPRARYNHVSLFCGAGGMDLGLKYAGFRTIFANDIEEKAMETFWFNLDPEKEVGELGDITSISFSPRGKNKVHLLTAGFPCQPFSNAGDRQGTKDPRGQLYLRVIEAVCHYKPQVVLLENVRGITTSKHGGRLVIDIIMSNLKELGYKVSFKLVDSSDYRVAQRRLRLLIVGTKLDEPFIFPKSMDKAGLTMGDVLSIKTTGLPNANDRVKLSPGTMKILSLVPIGGSWKDIPYENLSERFRKIRNNMKRYHAPKFYRKFTQLDICGTMTAAFTPENSCVWNPCNNQLMTVRDCARIQSFPDWYEFKGSTIRDRHKQIGNAVPPRLAYEIGLAIAAHLKGVSRNGGAVEMWNPELRIKPSVYTYFPSDQSHS
jgi:DNA (cytosine-5)-methyltransferase 1